MVAGLPGAPDETLPTQQQGAALTVVDAIDGADYYLFYAIRADLLRRLGRNTDAAAAYNAAIERTENGSELSFLRRRLSALVQP